MHKRERAHVQRSSPGRAGDSARRPLASQRASRRRASWPRPTWRATTSWMQERSWFKWGDGKRKADGGLEARRWWWGECLACDFAREQARNLIIYRHHSHVTRLDAQFSPHQLLQHCILSGSSISLTSGNS